MTTESENPTTARSTLHTAHLEHLYVYVGALLFNIVSVWTTQRGMKIILSGGDVFLRVWAPWLVAISLSLFLLHFTFRLASGRGGKRAVDILGYLLVAAISIFFNFNAIYAALAADEIEASQFLELRLRLSKESERSRHFIAAELRRIEDELAVVKAAMEFEKTRTDRPGSGTRWLALKEKYDLLNARAPLRKQEFETALAELAQVQKTYRSLPIPKTYESARASTARLKEQAERLAALMAPYDTRNTVDISALLSDSVDATSAEYSLETIMREISAALQGGQAGKGVYRFIISLLLAALIDLTVFCAVLLTGSAPTSSKDGRKPQRLAKAPWRAP